MKFNKITKSVLLATLATSSTFAMAEPVFLIGKDAVANDDYSIVIGNRAKALKNDSIAIGNGAKVSDDDWGYGIPIKEGSSSAIALGSGSYANRASGIDGYLKPSDIRTNIYAPGQDTNFHTTWNSTHGALAIGNDTRSPLVADLPPLTRQIIGLAAGTQDTDAVNVAQLKELEKKLTGQVSVGSLEIGEFNKFKNEISEYKNTVTLNNLKVANHETKITELSNQLKNSQNNVSSTEIQNMNNQISTNSKNITDLLSKFEVKENSLNEQGKTIQNLEKKLNDIQTNTITVNNNKLIEIENNVNDVLVKQNQFEIKQENKLKQSLNDFEVKQNDVLNNTVSNIKNNQKEFETRYTKSLNEIVVKQKEFENQVNQTQTEIKNNIAINTESIKQIDNKLMNFNQQMNNRLDNVNQRIDNLENQFKEGMANSAAMANLPQSFNVGQNVVSASIGGYDDTNAIAIGLSHTNNTGNLIFKGSAAMTINGNSDNKRKVSYGAGIGYAF